MKRRRTACFHRCEQVLLHETLPCYQRGTFRLLSIDYTRRSIYDTPGRACGVVSADPSCILIENTLKVEAINTCRFHSPTAAAAGASNRIQRVSQGTGSDVT